MNKDYKIIDLRTQYSNFVGDSNWVIVTDYSEVYLLKQYPELKQYQPFATMTVSQWEAACQAFTDYGRNDKKHEMRSMRHHDVFGYNDGETELYMKDLDTDIVSAQLDLLVAKEHIESALKHLTNVQMRRIVFSYYLQYTQREIAALEGVDKRAVEDSLNAAIKTLKKFL